MPTARILILALTLAAALQAATQTFAWMFRFDDALGPALRLGDTGVYWPWSILDWRRRFGGQQPEAFSLPISAFLLVSATGAGSMLLFAHGAVRRTRG